MPKKLYTIQIPQVSLEFAKHMDAIFPLLRVKPETSRDDIMWNSGIREVVEYIKNTAVNKEVSGDISKTRSYSKPYTYMQKLLSKVK